MGSQQVQSLIMMVLLFGMMYFLMIRPQRKKQKLVQKMREELKTGDRVITIGGTHGKIVKIKDEEITLEMDPDQTKLKFSKWAISSVKGADLDKK